MLLEYEQNTLNQFYVATRCMMKTFLLIRIKLVHRHLHCLDIIEASDLQLVADCAGRHSLLVGSPLKAALRQW